ncbi:MAG: sugar kinase [Anaerolineae bacterium]|jgi:sugar/nucleoside kinase (ribokinase family)|nr:sugar kinase [Anaerolineae bacterium]
MFDLLTFGEALVEIMRVQVGQPLHTPALFTGPYPSGAPFIFAVQAARLGARVAAVGAVGDDAFGECLLRQLAADGVDRRGVHTLPGHTTGAAFVGYQADGSREFVFHARHAAAGQLGPHLLEPAWFEGLRCLHIMGSSLSLNAAALATGQRALALAQAAGATISFDPNVRPQLLPVAQAREVFAPFMAAADVLLPTAEELHWLTGQTPAAAIADLLAQKPGRIILVTGGAAGCQVYHDGEPQGLAVPAFPVTEIDPTGAGDCFGAGFLVRWLAGDGPAAAARFAAACGALAVTAQGPMAGAKTLAEVEAFIAASGGG